MIRKCRIERCFMYTRETFGSKLSEKEIINAVIDHINSKLLKLYPKYIQTENGKNLALPLHNEMLEWLTVNIV